MTSFEGRFLGDPTEPPARTIDCGLSCEIPPGLDLTETGPERDEGPDVVRCPNECGKVFVTRFCPGLDHAVYEHEASDTGPWYQTLAQRITGITDPPEDDDPCQWCGGNPDPFADPDTACGCDPPEDAFPSPWIWTDDGISPGPGHPDNVGGSTP